MAVTPDLVEEGRKAPNVLDWLPESPNGTTYVNLYHKSRDGENKLGGDDDLEHQRPGRALGVAEAEEQESH